MATMTISIPNEIKLAMNEIDEINWSGFIRTQITDKINKIKLKESISGKIDNEMKESQFWIEKIKESRNERLKKLKAKGLI